MNDLVLRGVRVGDRLVDPSCVGGRVVALDDPGAGPAAAVDVALDGWLVLGAPVEPHAHLDKVFTADTVANPAGDLDGAIAAWAGTHGDRSVDEIAARAERALRRMVRAGFTAVRTHVDCGPGVDLRAVDALVGLRERYAPVIDVQVGALVLPPTVGEGSGAVLARLDEAIARGIDVVGGAPFVETDVRASTAVLLARAADAGLPVDFHTDETLDPEATGLAVLAELAVGFPGRVTASHCCALGMTDPGRQAEIAGAVAAAGVGVVALPLTNLFLLSRDRPTAPPRGLTAIGALESAGVALCAGGDNVQDPFNAMGRADAFETAALTVMAGHVEVTRAWGMVTDAARVVLGLAPAGPQVGAIADLLVVPANGLRAAVADAPPDRVVVRHGTIVARTETTVAAHPLIGD